MPSHSQDAHAEVIADALLIVQQLQDLLPTELYGTSKDWRESDIVGRVQWLIEMYEGTKAVRDLYQNELLAVETERVRDVSSLKSDGVQDVVRWMEADLKKQKARLDEASQQRSSIYSVGEFYDSERRAEEIRLQTMVEWKISTEKYLKKLRHQGE